MQDILNFRQQGKRILSFLEIEYWSVRGVQLSSLPPDLLMNELQEALSQRSHFKSIFFHNQFQALSEMYP